MKTIAELMAIIESLDISNEPEWKQKVIADSITRFNEIISDDYEMLEEGETKESLAKRSKLYTIMGYSFLLTLTKLDSLILDF